jgi:hypothetical protein
VPNLRRPRVKVYDVTKDIKDNVNWRIALEKDTTIAAVIHE